MKKLLTTLLALALLLTLAVPARADMLWVPVGNSFYDQHQDDCTYENRAYHANGQEGFVTVWDAPDGSRVKGQLENGEVLRIYWIYGDWGLVIRERRENKLERLLGIKARSLEGWVPLADLQLIYDHISFAEDHADRISDYNGEFADYAGDAEVVNFFAYPGAAEVRDSRELHGQSDILGNLTGSSDGESYIQSIFVDEDGLTWGYVNYLFGRLNAWFCLDQPDGESFPLREVDQPELIPARKPVLPAAGYAPYLLVGAAVLGTGALLLLFFRKRKK